MKVESNGETVISEKNIVPTITMDSVEVEKFSKLLGTEVAQVFIENEEGLTGRFMVRIAIENGRPKIIVDAYKKSKTHPVTTVTAVADWKL